MKIRTLTAAVVACGALAFAAQAQTNGSMSGPSGSMMQSHPGQDNQGCTKGSNHMASGAMATGDHMSSGAMASGDHMSSGAMASGDHMASGNHMASNTNGCQPASKPN